ncbi:hypothetical protein EGW08_016683, partial [Elysia chlorotica]
YCGNKSWVDCQKAWDHFVNPAVTTGLWTPEEKAKLKELVEAETSDAGAHKDWIQIAKCLGTGRTAFQCLSCYQRNFNTELRFRPWTKEQEQKLIEEANKVYESVGFFNWRKVSGLLDNRTPHECMLKFAQVDPNHQSGKFTPEEDAKLLAAVEMYGLKWREIARFIGTRNPVQVRDRYLDCLNPENNYLVFTYDEDLKLLKYYKEMGPVWAKIYQHFQGRSASRLGARFRQLQRWKKKKEWFDSQPVEVKRVLLGKSLPVRERRDIETRIRDYFVQQLGINLQDYKRQALDLRNGVDPDIIPPRPPFVSRLSNVRPFLETQSASHWIRKLYSHQTLRDNLERILREDAERRAQAKSAEKLPKVVEEENEEDLVNKAIKESLQEQQKAKDTQPKKTEVKRMERLLSRAFHQGTAVPVSKIFEVLKPNKEQNRSKYQKKHLGIDLALKKFFHQEGRENYRPGRFRKLFDADTRSKEIVREEKADLERTVPTICLKSLGSSLLQVYDAARRQHILIQEQLLNFPEVEADPEYLVQEARIDHQLDEALLAEGAEVSQNFALQEKCAVRKRKLQNIFQEKYTMEHKKLKTAAFSVQEDIAVFHRQLVQTGDLTRLPEDSLPLWLSREKEAAKLGSGEESASQAGCDPSADSSVSVPVQDTSEVKPHRFSNPDGRVYNTRRKRVKVGAKSGSQNGAKSSKQQSDASASSADSLSSTSGTGGLRFLGQDEVEEEQRRVERMRECVSSAPGSSPGSLPCLPPNVTNLTLLKSLLLRRGELLKQAAPLTDLDKTGEFTLPKHSIEIDGNKEPAQKVKEDIVLVDPQGKELKMEDYAEFIEEETQEDSAGKSNTAETDPSSAGTSGEKAKLITGTMKAFPSKEAFVRGKEQAKNLLTSNPEYNLANFLMGDSSKPQDSQGKPKEEKSSYEVVVVPTTKYHSLTMKINVPKDNFLPPKPLNRTGKTYATIIRKKRLKGLQDMKKASVPEKSSGEGSSNNQFEFPNLVHTGRELIEIEPNSSESSEGESEPDDHAESRHGTAKEMPETIDLTSDSQEKSEGPAGTAQQQQDPRKTQPGSNVIVVGLPKPWDADSKNGGSGADSFKAFKSKASTSSISKENPSGKVIGYEESVDVSEQPSIATLETLLKEEKLWKKIKALSEVRQSHEYKMLRSRMQALFMWPVLMSTVRPISNPRLKERIESAVPVVKSYPGNRKGRQPKAKGRGRPPKCPITKAKRLEQHMKTETYRRSQFMQQKRKERREARAAAAAATSSSSSSAAAAAATAADPTSSGVVYSEPVRLEDLTLSFPAPKGEEKNVGDLGTGEGHPVQEGSQATEEPGEKRAPDRPKGRPRGMPVKRKVYPPAIERPKRNPVKKPAVIDVPERPRKRRKAKEKSPVRKTAMEEREAARALPAWWKDAVLAAMMAQQTLERGEGGTKATEVPIDEDVDFVNRGDYSDDEWVQDWKSKERDRGGEGARDGREGQGGGGGDDTQESREGLGKE